MESSPVARSQSIWLSNFISYHVNKSQIKEIEILLSVLKVINILMPQTDLGVDTGRQFVLKWEFCFRNNIEIPNLVKSYLIVKLNDGC